MVRERLCRLVRKGGLSEGVGGLCYTNLKMGQGTRRIVATDCDEPLELTLRRWGDPLLKVLLADRTLSRPIRWATDGISALGRGFGRWDAMTPARVRKAVAQGLLRPRAAKSLEERLARVRAHGEVFTPAWICRRMTDVADEPWFCEHAESFQDTMVFPDFPLPADLPPLELNLRKGCRWQDYVSLRRLEVTCGEAPYLTARYDAATGEPIPWPLRHGVLDRKLRLLPLCLNRHAWRLWAERAFAATYGYEYQGDNLFLARCNLLLAFEEAHRRRWGDAPAPETLADIAETLSWNLWQMDGFTELPPCEAAPAPQDDLFAPARPPFVVRPCRLRVEGKTCTLDTVKGDKTMKFDFIIGNPPYQDETKGDNETYAPPTYHRFLDSAYTLSDRVEMIHPARFLFNAGSTPKAWNEKMLTDPHLKVEFYEPDASKVFPGTDIKGGVAITYRDATRDFGAIGTFIPWPELVATFKKVVLREGFKSLMEILHTQTKFNLEALYKDHPEYKEKIGSDGRDRRFRNNIFDKVDCFHAEPSRLGQTGMLREGALSKDEIAVYGVIKNKRVQRYIDRKYVDESHENLAKWKVFVPRANGSGALGEVLTTPLIGEPMVGSTQTFISFGSFDTKAEAEACLKYLKTKFTRAMLGILKITQDNDRDRWAYVPLQDFTAESGIDWGKSVAEIDRQLYKKYGLSEDEVAFIESKVKEMA